LALIASRPDPAPVSRQRASGATGTSRTDRLRRHPIGYGPICRAYRRKTLLEALNKATLAVSAHATLHRFA